MRTSALLAKALGRPDARWQPDQRRLKVRVGAGRDFFNRPYGTIWWWRIVDENGVPFGQGGVAPSQPAALALGLAALDTASVRRP